MNNDTVEIEVLPSNIVDQIIARENARVDRDLVKNERAREALRVKAQTELRAKGATPRHSPPGQPDVWQDQDKRLWAYDSLGDVYELTGARRAAFEEAALAHRNPTAGSVRPDWSWSKDEARKHNPATIVAFQRGELKMSNSEEIGATPAATLARIAGKKRANGAAVPRTERAVGGIPTAGKNRAKTAVAKTASPAAPKAAGKATKKAPSEGKPRGPADGLGREGSVRRYILERALAGDSVEKIAAAAQKKFPEASSTEVSHVRWSIWDAGRKSVKGFPLKAK